MRTLRLALRFSLREMRGGLSGFMIFLACIALGVAAIGGVNSVAQAITAGVANQGQTLLGGDLRFQINQRSASDAELGFIKSLGTVSLNSGMRSMARLEDGSDQALVEAKAVDDAYPLYGTLETDPQLPRNELFGERSGIFGAAAPDLLFDRLNLHIGDRLKLGGATFELRARLVSEPDAISDGFGFAPRLMISHDGLVASGLVQPGSLVENAYKIRLPDGASEARIKGIQAEAAKDFPQAGWSIRTRSNAAPALSANIQRFSQFLTLVGLTALVVGGVGVANAVRAYLDGKRGVIATFKSLGASGGFVFAIYLVQILLIAGLGIVLGLILGAAMPFVASALLQSVIPVPAQGGFYPGALAMAALFGLLVTLAFALLPLGRARDVPATALFREMGFESRGLPRLPYVGAALTIVLALAALAILFADDRRIASIFVGATVFAFLVLRLVAALVQWLARRSPRLRSVSLRLALGNIHRPGALTPSVVLSLGLGLTLLVTLALIDGNLRRQISGSLPERAPNFFFVDIQSSDVDAFAGLVEKEAPQGMLVKVPMLRGRIMALNGIDVDKVKVPADGANAVTRAFPAVTTVRVKDALDIVNRLVAQLGTAIRAAAGVALIASVLVLSGALAAGNRARIHDAVVLKTLGATRRTLIAAFSLEYVLIGLATALFALAAGGVAAWFVVARIMTLPSHFMPEVAVATILVSLAVTVGIGLAGTWRVLGHKAAPVLREL
ncbi:MAG: ABC transporter permease [Mesorhizobium sp.]|nr:MAG: ABC transporter permease [Mesorhizobium sp.]